MSYDELKNYIKEGEVKQIVTSTWIPFKKTYVTKYRGDIYFLKRKRKANFYNWSYCYDKDYLIVL